jgi:hypothetical protein
MSHFAKVVDGIVEQIIVADTAQWCETNLGGTWIQTSYNTYGNKYTIEGVTETELIKNPNWVEERDSQSFDISKYIGVEVPKKPLHKNFAGIGYTWDGTGFAAPQPYASWSLNAELYLWEAPIPAPTDGKHYTWDEATTSWVETAL